jgi:hypothetical protein
MAGLQHDTQRLDDHIHGNPQYPVISI